VYSKLLRAVILTALLFISENQLLAQIDSFDHKCLWVVRNTLENEQKIDEMLDFAESNEFDQLLVQVRGRGDAFYQSNIVPQTEYLAEPNFDPLKYVIEKAHTRGLKVHAWVNVYFIWAAEKRPRALHHVFNSKPHWLDSNGLDVEDILKNENGQRHFLAPHHPEVTAHLVAIFRELAALYEIDGLHLDYVRFKDAEYGNNVDAKTLFYQGKYVNKEKIFADKNGAVWDQHRRNSVTELVRQTRQMLNEVRPGCILSAAVKPNLFKARNRYFQEWDVWLAAEYLDWVMPMNYSTDIRDFAENIDIIYDHLPKKLRDKIMMGIALYNQDGFAASDKIKYSKITRFKGISLFSYNVFSENKNYINQLIIDH